MSVRHCNTVFVGGKASASGLYAGVLRDSVMHRPALLGKMGNERSGNRV